MVLSHLLVIRHQEQPVPSDPLVTTNVHTSILIPFCLKEEKEETRISPNNKMNINKLRDKLYLNEVFRGMEFLK